MIDVAFASFSPTKTEYQYIKDVPISTTVDKPEDIGRLLEMEVDGLIADDPLLAAAYIRR